MGDPSRYFDHAATTPVDPRVLAEMLPYFGERFGNSESLHGFGQRAQGAVDLARERVARLMDAEFPEQIIFTSGATEACNWVIRNFDGGAIGPFEHHAVREPALSRGWSILPANGFYPAPPTAGERFPIAAQMMVNNEVGTAYDLRHREWSDLAFSDVTQALGKIPIDRTEIDFMAASAHKLYGPQGVGALFIHADIAEASQLGGDQERGLRAGTLNVPGIVGFGVACAIAEQEMDSNRQSAQTLAGIVMESLAGLADHQINGGERRVPHILSISFGGLQGETLVVELDALGFAVSSGAACSSRNTDQSHVLQAAGVPEEFARGTVRISFGTSNTADSAHALGVALRGVCEKLRDLA